MLKNINWRRLWIVGTVAIVAAMIVRSLRNPNVMNVSGSDWDCVPNTYHEDAFSNAANGAATFSCTSYAGVIFAIIAGLVISVGIAVIFRIFRRIVAGSGKA
jgi:hypothetical protein